ncbi:MAG: hypothetical protein IK093_20060 [Ruminiclostridium sp.]|nr:hypothetical protein [Ruminiclostridium sp.]
MTISADDNQEQRLCQAILSQSQSFLSYLIDIKRSACDTFQGFELYLIVCASQQEQADTVIKGLKEWGYEPVEGKNVCAETRTLDDIMEDL